MDNRTIVSSIDVTKQIASATLRSVSTSAATPLASDTSGFAHHHQTPATSTAAPLASDKSLLSCVRF